MENQIGGSNLRLNKMLVNQKQKLKDSQKSGGQSGSMKKKQPMGGWLKEKDVGSENQNAVAKQQR